MDLSVFLGTKRRRRVRLAAAFLLSVGLHLGLIFLLTGQSHEPSQEPQRLQLNPNHSAPVAVEVVTKSPAAPQASQIPGGLAPRRKRGAHLGLNALLPKIQLRPGVEAAASPNESDETATLVQQESERYKRWQAGQTHWGRIENDPARALRVQRPLEELYQSIQGVLSYPEGLGRRNIEGAIHARIVLNRHGKCQPNEGFVRGRQVYLEKYVRDLIKKVCEIPVRLNKGQNFLVVDASFNFYLSSRADGNERWEEGEIHKQTLLFVRRHPKSLIDWELGPLKGNLAAPMVFLNVPWIAEKWDELVNKKKPLDPYKD